MVRDFGEREGSPEVEKHRINDEEYLLIEQYEREIAEMEGALQGKLVRKKRMHLKRKLGLYKGRLEKLKSGDFGRRIPNEVQTTVFERDRERDFNRPNHSCEGVHSLHHIRHFEGFTGDHTRENPHAEDNIEAPCGDCHKLAHVLDVPDGSSVADFFQAIDSEVWAKVEELWQLKKISELQKLRVAEEIRKGI